MTHIFKIVVIGDGGVGKTTWCKRLMMAEFEKQYIPTYGKSVFNLDYNTYDPDRCLIDPPVWLTNASYSIWDCAGYHIGMTEVYTADSAFIFYDRTSISSYNNAFHWAEKFRQMCPSAPIVFVCNKVDIKNSTVSDGEFLDIVNKFKKASGSMISAKSNYNFEQPMKMMYDLLIKELDKKA